MRFETLGLSAFLAGLLTATPAAAANPVKFNRDIRPIMSDTCFRCHGPDAKARMAGLRLDIRGEALKKTKSGIIPIVPGDPEKSAIIQRVFAPDARIMPPAQAHKTLTGEQKQTLKRWVAEGAVYEGHWAYEPVKRPPVPQVEGATNPIDAFIRARLEKDGLQPAAEADRRTLLRRITFDLTGVPPTPEEMAAFLNDGSPTAYESAVDRLLASPRHAEKLAAMWLDWVRYGDSAGFHGDNLWPAWPYRDYVLRAFRDNKPFDVFTREQLAGDLIPDATREQRVASAYNRLNRASAEGGLQPKEYLAKYGADRVRTTSTVWLASTLGCAECHDHKFDPFTAEDFYSMKAFFSDIKETGLIPDRGAKAWGSRLRLPTPAQEAALEELNRKLENAREELTEAEAKLEERRWAWEGEVLKAYRAGDLAWQFQKPTRAESENGSKLTVYTDQLLDSNYYLNGSLASERKRGEGVVVASGNNPDTDTYTVEFQPGAGQWTALGIEIFQDESLPGNRLARGADRFVLSEVEAEADGRRIPFVLATSTSFGETVDYPAMNAIDGETASGWAVSFGEARNPFVALRCAEPFSTSAGTTVRVRLRQLSPIRRATIGRFRLALSRGLHSYPETGDSARKAKSDAAKGDTATLAIAVDRGVPADVLEALETLEENRTEEQVKLAKEHFEWAAPQLQALYVKTRRLEVERDRLETAIPRVLTTERVRPRQTRILPRGNFLDETGKIVEPAIPKFLGHVETNGQQATRLDLANWIASPENPLTPRVFVNRMWRQFFGTGLSKIMEDLGSQGEWPTHPELLDWMASEFVHPEFNAGQSHPFDIRHAIRTIVTSATYKQSSVAPAQLAERDPDNRLLARQTPIRIEAEAVRDTALAISGLLQEKFGGPSVRPYEPEGYLGAMNFPKRDYSESHGGDLYRRSLYTQWQRTFLHPMLASFDAPTREECAVTRVNSNTPQQALELLNDPIFVEASRVFAARILAEGGSKLDQQLAWAFRHALNRDPQKTEARLLASLYGDALKSYKKDQAPARQLIAIGETPAAASGDPARLAAMTMVARAIFNLHETITRN